MNTYVDVLDRDARTLYDLACIRAEREDATREDVEAQAIALRLWRNLAAIAELIDKAETAEQALRNLVAAGAHPNWANYADDLRAALARVGGAK